MMFPCRLFQVYRFPKSLLCWSSTMRASASLSSITTRFACISIASITITFLWRMRVPRVRLSILTSSQYFRHASLSPASRNSRYANSAVIVGVVVDASMHLTYVTSRHSRRNCTSRQQRPVPAWMVWHAILVLTHTHTHTHTHPHTHTHSGNHLVRGTAVPVQVLLRCLLLRVRFARCVSAPTLRTLRTPPPPQHGRNLRLIDECRVS